MAMRVTKFCSQMSRCPTAADGRFGVPPLVEVFNPNEAMMQNLHQDLNRNMLDIYDILSLSLYHFLYQKWTICETIPPSSNSFFTGIAPRESGMAIPLALISFTIL